MKKLLATTAIALFATTAYAQETTAKDQITADLQAQGFEVNASRSFFGRTRVDATLDGVEFEFVFRNATQELLDVDFDESSLSGDTPSEELVKLFEDLDSLFDLGEDELEDLIEELEEEIEDLEDELDDLDEDADDLDEAGEDDDLDEADEETEDEEEDEDEESDDEDEDESEDDEDDEEHDDESDDD